MNRYSSILHEATASAIHAARLEKVELPSKHEVSQEMLTLEESGRQISTLASSLTKHLHIGAELSSLESIVGGELTRQNAVFLRGAVQALNHKEALTALPAMECFDYFPADASNLTMESLKATALSIWEKVKAMVAKFWGMIMKFFDRVKELFDKNEEKLLALKEKLKKANVGKLAADATIDIGSHNTRLLQSDGKSIYGPNDFKTLAGYVDSIVTWEKSAASYISDCTSKFVAAGVLNQTDDQKGNFIEAIAKLSLKSRPAFPSSFSRDATKDAGGAQAWATPAMVGRVRFTIFEKTHPQLGDVAFLSGVEGDTDPMAGDGDKLPLLPRASTLALVNSMLGVVTAGKNLNESIKSARELSDKYLGEAAKSKFEKVSDHAMREILRFHQTGITVMANMVKFTNIYVAGMSESVVHYATAALAAYEQSTKPAAAST